MWMLVAPLCHLNSPCLFTYINVIVLVFVFLFIDAFFTTDSALFYRQSIPVYLSVKVILARFLLGYVHFRQLDLVCSAHCLTKVSKEPGFFFFILLNNVVYYHPTDPMKLASEGFRSISFISY